MKDRVLQRSDKTCNCIGSHAHLATAAHDLCHCLAGRLLRVRFEGKVNTLGEDLL